MPLIRIISRDNGVGLSRDMQLVAGAAASMPDAEVELFGFSGGSASNRVREVGLRVASAWRGRADLQIFLERVYQRCLPAGRKNLLVPNPEWFLPKWRPLLPLFDGVLCKTMEAERTFSAMGCRTRHIGFTSQDRYLADVERLRRFFHLAGHSAAKNTDLLLRLWARHPEWPQLTVVQDARKAIACDLPNVRQLTGYMEDEVLRRLQNQHLFHLCPSRAEGFGHYIVEGLSVGAVVLATNGAPMNELVTSGYGVLVPVSGSEPERLGMRYHIDELALEAAVLRMLALDDGQLQTMSAAARRHFLQQDQQFNGRFAGAIGTLLGGATAASVAVSVAPPETR